MQVAEATALRSLSFSLLEQSAEELSVLASLGPSLQRLSVAWCRHLPAPDTLSQLVQLRALHICQTPRRGQAQEVCTELQVGRAWGCRGGSGRGRADQGRTKFSPRLRALGAAGLQYTKGIAACSVLRQPPLSGRPDSSAPCTPQQSPRSSPVQPSCRLPLSPSPSSHTSCAAPCGRWPPCRLRLQSWQSFRASGGWQALCSSRPSECGGGRPLCLAAESLPTPSAPPPHFL